MPLRLRRGTNADRTTITPVQGEPIYTTDTKQLYIGDGTTAGGVQVGGGGTLTVNTQDFTASGTWTKPANAVWVEVTMCGAGQAGSAGFPTGSGSGGSAGRSAKKTFAAADLPSTVSITCGASQLFGISSNAAQSSFGTYLYAPGPSTGASDHMAGSTIEAVSLPNQMYGNGGDMDSGTTAGLHGAAHQGGGGGHGGNNADLGSSNGFAGGLAGTQKLDFTSGQVASGGGGAGGASGTTGVAGTAGGYDTITGFGHGGGGGGEGTAGAGGAGGAAVRGGGGGGGGKGTTAGGAGGAGGAGFVRVRTLCFG